MEELKNTFDYFDKDGSGEVSPRKEVFHKTLDFHR